MLAIEIVSIDNIDMSLNMDLQTERAPWGTLPTPEEATEVEMASYVVSAIGSATIAGYTNDLETAYGRALWIAHRTMEHEGSQIDVKGINKKIELRISKDRGAVTVQWVDVEDQPPPASA